MRELMKIQNLEQLLFAAKTLDAVGFDLSTVRFVTPSGENYRYIKLEIKDTGDEQFQLVVVE